MKNTFDSDERQIHTAFSQIKVNPRPLKSRVTHRLRNPHPETALPFKSLLAAVLAVLFISTAVFLGATGAFDRFMEGLAPPPAETPSEPFSEGGHLTLTDRRAEDQGISVIVTEVEQSGNTVRIILSIRDVSGEGRLTPQASLRGFWLASPIDGEPLPNIMSYGQRLLRFREDFNTAYLELEATKEENLPFQSPPVLEFTHIFFQEEMDWNGGITGEWRIPLHALDAGHDTILLTEGFQVDAWFFESITLSPFRMHVTGQFHFLYTANGELLPERQLPSIMNMVVGLESHDGVRLLTHDYSNMDFGEENVFTATWRIDGPLDLHALTAIVIDGHQIPLPQSNE